MVTLTRRPARMEFKTTADTKKLLSAAAALTGVDLTAFVISSASERARALLADHSVLKLNAAEHARFLKLVDKAPKPSKALRALMAMPELPTR